jgi:hypothetical protein
LPVREIEAPILMGFFPPQANPGAMPTRAIHAATAAVFLKNSLRFIWFLFLIVILGTSFFEYY